jgi:hypothetical protein
MPFIRRYDDLSMVIVGVGDAKSSQMKSGRCAPGTPKLPTAWRQPCPAGMSLPELRDLRLAFTLRTVPPLKSSGMSHRSGATTTRSSTRRHA